MNPEQQREHAVTCWCGRATWDVSALCPAHRLPRATRFADPAGLRRTGQVRCPETGEFFDDDGDT